MEAPVRAAPADAYFGRDRQIHTQRAAIKKQTIEHRRYSTPKAPAYHRTHSRITEGSK